MYKSFIVLGFSMSSVMGNFNEKYNGYRTIYRKPNEQCELILYTQTQNLCKLWV